MISINFVVYLEASFLRTCTKWQNWHRSGSDSIFDPSLVGFETSKVFWGPQADTKLVGGDDGERAYEEQGQRT